MTIIHNASGMRELLVAILEVFDEVTFGEFTDKEKQIAQEELTSIEWDADSANTLLTDSEIDSMLADAIWNIENTKEALKDPTEISLNNILTHFEFAVNQLKQIQTAYHKESQALITATEDISNTASNLEFRLDGLETDYGEDILDQVLGDIDTWLLHNPAT